MQELPESISDMQYQSSNFWGKDFLGWVCNFWLKSEKKPPLSLYLIAKNLPREHTPVGKVKS